ncbi:MAG TPA: trimethylamine methyltransferase family protein [Acidobacteriota bacterium]
MSPKTKAFVPRVKLLDRAMITRIIDEAFEILAKVGDMIENEEALELLGDHGAQVDLAAQRAHIPRDLVERALKSAPKQFKLWDLTGKQAVTVGGDHVLYDPGSAALNVLESDTLQVRRAVGRDYARLARLVEQLPHLRLNSTALVCSDVPVEISDSYRLFLAVQHCRKPLVTGLFRTDGFDVMHKLMVAVRGSEAALRKKPFAVYDACPSPPLRWSELTTHSLLRCAAAGVPSNIIAMPLTGATGPITLLGSVAQHTAENLCGLVLTQLANPGSPAIYGGAPCAFDMRRGTTPMGAIETVMLDLAYNEIGKALGLPVHSYIGLSDSKLVDTQAGYETGIGILFAALARINVVSGAGILDYITCQSLEKLVIDNELCGMAYRLLEGMVQRTPTLAIEALTEVMEEGHFMAHPTTLEFFRKEFLFPGPVVDRTPTATGEEEQRTADFVRAREQVELLLDKDGFALPADTVRELESIMLDAARRCGLDRLPETR